MADETVKCVHGIEGVHVVVECNQSLRYAIDDALNALRQTCEWEAGDGYYRSACGHSHSATDEPQETWKFCPHCGGKIPKPITPLDGDRIDLHG